MEIVEERIIETADQITELAERYGQIVIPTGNDDLDLTHWWIIREDGSEMLYLGTPETFATYIREKSGVQ